jgi:hypothetical protein
MDYNLASPGSKPGGLADIGPPSGTTMDNFYATSQVSSADNINQEVQG